MTARRAFIWEFAPRWLSTGRGITPFVSESTWPPMTRSPSHRKSLETIRAAPRPPVRRTGSGQIPWHEPAFSERMLAVHLDPETHMASRTPAIISRHIDWLLAQLDRETSAHILDVGCGPGLYCHELARRGHRATGFDFAPAPLAWARTTARADALDATFVDADLTRLPADFGDIVGAPVDAITFWFGEFHSFAPEVVESCLTPLVRCLRPGGLFVLEYQPEHLFVTEAASQWSACDESVFCDRPHLWLEEFGWDQQSRLEIHVHWIIEQESGTLHRYEQCQQAWSDAELVDLLARTGLGEPTFHAPITGVDQQFEFPLLVTRKGS